MRSLELFGGCGGLALGVSRAGFKPALVVEQDARACETLSYNQNRKIDFVRDWPLLRADVRNIRYGQFGNIDLLTGGPPCQPFSVGGKHHGHLDERNMWPEALRAVQELQPKAFLFENVRGLLRPLFEQYLDFLRLQLSWPEIRQRKNESWQQQYARLSSHNRKNDYPTYKVLVQGINAADYGAPQKRHRAIIIGIRTDLTKQVLLPPSPTHSREALIWSKYITGQYWKDHDLPPKRTMTISDQRILEKLSSAKLAPAEKPWVTVRDAIGNLPIPNENTEPVLNHSLRRGARSYPGHTGSSWDEPAKALKAGDHGVPGGENMLLHHNGKVRYFTIREMARLQGFPDDYAITGAWASSIKQLGNAVPVQVGEVFAKQIQAIIKTGGSVTRKVA